MKFGIIVFPGTNCEEDCYWAIKETVNLEAEYLWHKEVSVQGYDCLVIPGGFSYGDYLRTGSIAKTSPVMDAVIAFAESGGLVIGICNGFQILLEVGLLPGAMQRNKNLKFICKKATVSLSNQDTPFTQTGKKGDVLSMPIRHAEGNYFIDQGGLRQLIDNEQIILQYCSPSGVVSEEYNPNGSIDNIAGICNKEKNVFGLMPHPEAACDKWIGSLDGRVIFDSIVSV